jgi:hypothetical protein
MSGTFTLTGKLASQDGSTPIVGAVVRVTSADFSDTTTNTVYTGGITAVTDINGSFSMTLVSESDIRYTLTCDRASFGAARFLPAGDGDSLDLSDIIASSGGSDLSGDIIDGGTP